MATKAKQMNLKQKLIAMQSELHAPKNQKNTFGGYNYRSCEDILEALKPLLKKYECALMISDDIIEVCGIPICESVVMIEDTESDESISVKSSAGINPSRS